MSSGIFFLHGSSKYVSTSFTSFSTRGSRSSNLNLRTAIRSMASGDCENYLKLLSEVLSTIQVDGILATAYLKKDMLERHHICYNVTSRSACVPELPVSWWATVLYIVSIRARSLQRSSSSGIRSSLKTGVFQRTRVGLTRTALRRTRKTRFWRTFLSR